MAARLQLLQLTLFCHTKLAEESDTGRRERIQSRSILYGFRRVSAILKFELFICYRTYQRPWIVLYEVEIWVIMNWTLTISLWSTWRNHHEKASKFGRGVHLSWSHRGSKFSSEILFVQTPRKSSARCKVLQKRKFYTKIRSNKVAEKYINWSKGLAVWFRAAHICTGIFNILFRLLCRL